MRDFLNQVSHPRVAAPLVVVAVALLCLLNKNDGVNEGGCDRILARGTIVAACAYCNNRQMRRVTVPFDIAKGSVRVYTPSFTPLTEKAVGAPHSVLGSKIGYFRGADN